MQKTIRYILILFLLCKTGISLAQVDSIVNVNRVKYQQLRNKLDEYETVKSTFTVESGENVQGTAFYAGTILEIIEVIYLSESGHRQIEYYFENGNLFFSLERIQPAEEEVALNIKGNKSSKTASTSSANKTLTENRYYFYLDKLIRGYDTNRNVFDLSSQTITNTGKEMVASAYKLKENLKK